MLVIVMCWVLPLPTDALAILVSISPWVSSTLRCFQNVV